MAKSSVAWNAGGGGAGGGASVGSSVGRLVGWSVGRLVGWSVGRVVGRSVGASVTGTSVALGGMSDGRAVGLPVCVGFVVEEAAGVFDVAGVANARRVAVAILLVAARVGDGFGKAVGAGVHAVSMPIQEKNKTEQSVFALCEYNRFMRTIVTTHRKIVMFYRKTSRAKLAMRMTMKKRRMERFFPQLHPSGRGSRNPDILPDRHDSPARCDIRRQSSL